MNYMMPHSPKETIKLIDSGILKGKTFLVKDMCDVKGIKCSCGNPDFYKKCLPANDFAPFLKKILLEGASLHGITICDEFFYTVIGENTTLGQNCLLSSNISIYDNCTIGNNVIVHSNTSIGCDGFGYVTENDFHEKIPQEGNVIIEDNVEIGSNCAIDRATIGSTVIGEMTKIDNLVHIAHNVKIGKGCLLTAGFAIAGSSEIGNYCTFAGQVGVAPHLKVGDRSIVASKSGITKSLKGGKVYAGFPAREIKDHNKQQALINQIGRLRKKLDILIKNQSKH